MSRLESISPLRKDGCRLRWPSANLSADLVGRMDSTKSLFPFRWGRRLWVDRIPPRNDAASRKTPARPCRQQGMILIALLWVLVALSLLALNLSSTVRSEVNVTLASGESEKAYFYARGGLETALYRMIHPEKDPEKQKRLFSYRDGMNHFSISNEESRCHVAIQDEAGRVDVNFANQPLLKRLMLNIGVEERQADLLAESIVGWREPDKSSRSGGDERALRGNDSRPHLFSSVEELLLIPGVSREILYGNVQRNKDGNATLQRGLADFVTVYSEKAQINLNYAEPEVIAALPGVARDAAEAIVRERAEESLSSGRVAQQIASLIPGEAASLITTEPSKVYSLVATGFLKNSKLRTSIRVVVKLDGNLKWGHSKLIWYDEYWPSARILSWTKAMPASQDSVEVGLNPRS